MLSYSSVSLTASLFAILACIFALTVVKFARVIYHKHIHVWIFEDLRKTLCHFFIGAPSSHTHIMFAFVDHFEPGNRGALPHKQQARVDAWITRYPPIAAKHADSDGCFPKHTFFFPPHYDTADHLKRIVDLCSKGYGEVEMHLHHDRLQPWPDDASSLRQKILDCINSFSRYGVFCLPNGDKRFAFIHGDWALANSLKGAQHCGVNDELTILEETGCFADLTFPVSNEAQPELANTIFYAQSNRDAPKGYSINPQPVEVGRKIAKGLMLIQGVIGLRWKSRLHKFKPSIEQSNIDKSDYPFNERVDYWIRKRIHVKGMPNWIFIKIHTHGAREIDWDILLGKPCDDMFTYLEAQYNDGAKYSLHYVSARELYNIIKAAEDGKTGNPNEYRDYLIPPYVYLHQHRFSDDNTDK
ncbi:MAG: hypothetical protein AB2L21_00060 [Anaerolineaceae bacterium]